MDGTYVSCEEDIGLLVSGWCGNSSIECARNVGLPLFFSFTTSGGSLTTSCSGSGDSSSIGSGSCNGDEDTPLAVHVGNSQGKLILIGLELELSQGFVDDEGICLSAEFADLSVGNIKTDDVGT